jgi:serine/threonine-protein kinase
MDPVDAVALVVQIAKGLWKAHKAAIVHRDIKPDNIFLCDTEPSARSDERGEIFVKLLDFGTAKREDASTSRTTEPGQIMGTPHYMSPEQSVGGEIDERSDIWSLGVVVFEALTGRRPFDGGSIGAITMAIHGPLPKMSDFAPELPVALDDWFARACAQVPQDRFATVREASHAFVEAVTGSAPNDQPTESVYLPSVQPKEGSTPVQPVTRPIQPLISSLPERGSERRPTTIAAGIVMAMAGIAMAAIVLHRSPAPATPSQDSTAAAEAANGASAGRGPGAGAEPAAPPPVATSTAVAGPANAASAPEAKVDSEPAAGPSRPAAAARQAPVPARGAHAKPSLIPAKHGGPQQKQKEIAAPSQDDDLDRLRNASAQHADPAPPASPPNAEVAPLPAPSAPREPEAPPPLPAPTPDPAAAQ